MKVIGIMGGMGPDATVDLYNKIIQCARLRGARRDQDHPEVVISSVPQTPDRTLAIFGKGPSPEPELVRSARRLEGAGADMIAIPCNTAHHYLSAIRSAVKIPIIDMMRETVQYIVRQYPALKKVGILATDGTLRTRLYHNALEEAGLGALSPDQKHQHLVMEAIYGEGGIKESAQSPVAMEKLEAAADHLISCGAQILIAACTEIPLALRADRLSLPLVDATFVLAEAAVDAAYEAKA